MNPEQTTGIMSLVSWVMNAYRIYRHLLTWIALCLSSYIPTAVFAFDGYYKNFFTVFTPPAYESSGYIEDTPYLGSVNTTIRLNHTFRLQKNISVQTAYNFSPRVQDRTLFSEQTMWAEIDPTDYRFTDFEAQLYPGDDDPVGSVGVFHNLDRAMMTVSLPSVDIIIGRQPIAWGSARVINPTDVIAPFSFSELDKEERYGVDAVRFRKPVGLMGELDGGVILGDKFENDKSAVFLRGKFYAAQTDVSVLGLKFRNHFLIGLDIARSIGGAGFWWEGAYVSTGAFGDRVYESGNNYFRGSAGFDYNFAGDFYGIIEYHYNRAGSNDPIEYSGLLNNAAYTDGSVYLLGRHYIAPGLTYQLSPLVMVSGQSLFNVHDQSMYIAPQIEYNIRQDIYLASGTFIAIGKKSDPNNNFDFLFHSEFGSYYNIYYASFRVYF